MAAIITLSCCLAASVVLNFVLGFFLVAVVITEK